MVVTLYYMKPSPFTRPVLLTMKALGVTLELKEVNTFKGEQLKPEFVAINPQHTVPTLADGDLTVCERWVWSAAEIGSFHHGCCFAMVNPAISTAEGIWVLH